MQEFITPCVLTLALGVTPAALTIGVGVFSPFSVVDFGFRASPSPVTRFRAPPPPPDVTDTCLIGTRA